MDGVLAQRGRRLLDLSMMEMLNLTYALLVAEGDEEHRKKIHLAMEGRLGANGGEIINDPDLPEAIQGMEAPSWWNSDHDPFADQHTLGGTDASFHGVR